ncbi:MAG: hypothetical protein IT460_12990 [Planctomycetes bacterium]|nr:hypothetical protein [Planctomycetota bacterium]
MAPSVCDACGSRRVVPRVVEGVEIEQCELCDALVGDDVLVAEVETRLEARERGFDPLVYPLVRALELIPKFRVAAAEPGRPERAEYPFVFLRLEEGSLVHLERLLTSLEMANRETRRRWVVECTLQRGLLFVLRPRFWKRVADITAGDIEEARADLEVLGRTISRDVRLPWWGGAADA